MEELTKEEVTLLKKLNTPAKIQNFLETLKPNFEKKRETCMSPRRVLREKKSHCFEGALLAALALSYHGQKPLLLDLKVIDTKKDNDHVVTLFREGKYWGAISKTNHAVLRYREPVYKSVRELALSYFHEYFTDDGKKTLMSFSKPFDLSRFNKRKWSTDEKDLWYLPKALDTSPHELIVPLSKRKKFRLADPVEIKAGKIQVKKPKY